jgi:hypothetical protein
MSRQLPAMRRYEDGPERAEAVPGQHPLRSSIMRQSLGLQAMQA